MIEEPVIVFFSLPRHDGAYTSTPWQLAKELGLSRKVVFLDHPFTWWEAFKLFRTPAVKKRWRAYGSSSTAVVQGVHVLYAPFVWPINFLPKGFLYNFLSAWNHRLVAARLNRFLDREANEGYIFVNSFNFYFPRLTRFLRKKPSLRAYHCIDPMIKPFTRKHGIDNQRELAIDSDLVISTAPSLQRQFWNIGVTKNFLVPNGANASLFYQACNPALPVHPRLQHVTGRVMGFLGNIERRTDFSLLERVLEVLPQWQLVMAGPCEWDCVPLTLRNHPRVTWLGSVSHGDAPAVVKRFDVALIPFRYDEASAGIYPLKMFEYLASGKPVVTTNFNREILGPLKELIFISEGADSFANNVQKAYATDDEFHKLQRVEMAFRNTWHERAALFQEILHAEWVEKNVSTKLY